MTKANTRKIILPILTFPVFIALWKLYIYLTGVEPYLLPQPEAVLNKLIYYFTEGDMMAHLVVTLQEIFIGTFIGVIAGLMAGYILAKSRFVERIVMPFVLVVQTAPKISLAPLFILWFGLGLESKIALVILVVFFPIMVNEVMAIRSIDANMHNLMKILNATRFQELISVEIPYSLPSILAGIKVATTQAIVGAVIGEMIGAKAGLGYLLTLGNETYDILLVLCSIVVLSIIGLILYMAASLLEKKLLYWDDVGEEIIN